MFSKTIQEDSIGGTRIALAELLGAFSYALDLTEGAVPGHCVRACWIGVQLGRQIGLPEAVLQDLFYTLLLKDLGCSSNAGRVSQLYLADERVLKHDFKLIGPNLRDAVGFVLSKTGKGASPLARIGAVARLVRNGRTLMRDVIEIRCTRGSEIARQLRFSEQVADGIFNLDEHWDGSGHPQGLRGHAIPILSRIALLAQLADVFHQTAGPEAALAEIRRRAGNWLDPELVTAFAKLAAEAGFWRQLASPTIDAELMALDPARHTIFVDDDYLDDIAAAFGTVVDAKSPYTGGHSQRVTRYVDAIAERLGVTLERRRWLRRGALLHDIGKLGVSNRILDKPAPLSDEEWILMRDHAAHTQAILSRVSCLHDLAAVASAHHERLDGAGYPLRLDQHAISLETRIITVGDYYDALTADRPYRAAMPIETALAVMEKEVSRAIDPDCFAALREIAV